jgi:hypothetical protein
VASVHPAFVSLAEMNHGGSFADFVGDDTATVTFRYQIPSVIVRRGLARGMSVPANAGERHELGDLALERQIKGRPGKLAVLRQD